MQARTPSLVIAISLTIACGSEPVRSTTPARPEIEPPPVELLPAGIYWLGYKTCESCARPVAITGAATASIDAARALVATAPEDLPIGYPLVIHTDQIESSAPEGILVVYGLHAEGDDADAWLAYQARLGLQSSRHAVEGGDHPPTREGAQVVVQTLPGEPIPAFRVADVAAAETAAYEADRWPAPREVGADLEPACMVEPGSIFAAAETDLEWYRWAPVRCGDEPALIRWRASRLGNAVVMRRRDGFVLRQITAVECDTPSFGEWRFSRDGVGAEQPLADTGGC